MSNRPQQYKATVKSTTWISSKVIEIVLESIEPKEFNFIPGQFLSLDVGEGIYRSYSITGDPHAASELKIIATAKHKGAGSDYLKSLKQGSEVTFIGPSGKFVLQKDANPENIILVGTGTGISPLVAMLYDLAHMKSELKIHLYFGVRNEDELFYEDLLNTFTEQLDFNYTICVSNPTSETQHKTGRVAEHFAIAEPQNTHVYLCGHPNMVEEMVEKLNGLEVPEENVFYEKYTHSKK
jgi:ferredoxin-NADP reductase